MKRLIFPVLLLAAAVRSTSACQCADIPAGKMIDSNSDIFVGRLTATDTIFEPVPGQPGTLSRFEVYRFNVLASWKGAPDDTIVVWSSGSCEPRYVPGFDLLVYVFEQDGRLWGSLCAPGNPIQHSLRERYVLGPPERLTPDYSIEPVTLEDLFRELGSKDDATRRSAARGIGREEAGDDPVFQRLRGLLVTGTAEEREGALMAIGFMRPRAPRTIVPDVERLLDSPIASTRLQAHDTLHSVLWHDGYFPYAVRALSDPDEHVCSRGLYYVTRCVASDTQRCELVPTLERIARNEDFRWVGDEAVLLAQEYRARCSH